MHYFIFSSKDSYITENSPGHIISYPDSTDRNYGADEILELKKDIREIKKRLLDPDDGVVARINWNTSFRKSARIWLGVFFTSLIGIVTKMLFE